MVSPSLKLFFKERQVALFTVSALALLLFSAALIIVYIGPRAGNVPLHYNIYFGIDSFGPWYEALYAPLAAACLLIINTGLSYYLYTRDKYNAYFLLATATLVNLLVFLYSVSLIANR